MKHKTNLLVVFLFAMVLVLLGYALDNDEPYADFKDTVFEFSWLTLFTFGMLTILYFFFYKVYQFSMKSSKKQ